MIRLIGTFCSVCNGWNILQTEVKEIICDYWRNWEAIEEPLLQVSLLQFLTSILSFPESRFSTIENISLSVQRVTQIILISFQAPSVFVQKAASELAVTIITATCPILSEDSLLHKIENILEEKREERFWVIKVLSEVGRLKIQSLLKHQYLVRIIICSFFV